MTRLILKVVQNQVDLAVPVVGKLGQCGKISDASGGHSNKSWEIGL